MEKNAKGFEFRKFATPRIIGGIAIMIIVLWALSIIFGTPQGPSSDETAVRQLDSPAATAAADHGSPTATGVVGQRATAGTTGHATTGSQGTPAGRKAADTHDASEATGQGPTTHVTTTAQKTDGSHTAPAAGQPTVHGTAAKTADSAPAPQAETHRQPAAAADHSAQTSDHDAASQTAAKQGDAGHAMPAATAAPVHKPAPKGVAFTEAAIKPLSYELEERWWGWRPNDIIEFTDNVNNFQLGVLEVTRRTVVALAERISRTGVTDTLDPNLEDAMNWFMVKASSYWFPSAESKYHEGLEELQAYLEKLRAGNATFYTRTDNLIPLLASFEDLLGSCDKNLVKEIHEDGTPLSIFDADNYFFYTKGVSSSMATVLEAVHHDFLLTLESRNATELLHHAIVSCQQAAELDPWIVLDRNLSSIFANHRANMAAPISHARFYIGQLIKTLST
ncbi:MAG: DUF2333 family protein [Desulfosarcina sp.]|nr:DUF2333 family protein [Desulfosarcina sp.]